MPQRTTRRKWPCPAALKEPDPVKHTANRNNRIGLRTSGAADPRAVEGLAGWVDALGSLGFRWSYGVLAGSADRNTVHLARLIAAEKRAGLDVHDISFCWRQCRCSLSSQGMLRWSCPTNSADGLCASLRQRPDDGAHQWSLSLFWRLAIVVRS